MQATYINSNKFSVFGDKVDEFISDRRLKMDGDGEYYCTIESSVISGSYTIVTIKESGLTSGLNSVLYGIVAPGISGSLPDHKHNSEYGSGGVVNTILDDTTLYISVSGSDTTGDGSLSNPWATFESFMEYIYDKKIASSKLVTIKYLDGSYTVSGVIDTWQYPQGSQVLISGDTVLDLNITSVQSSSGSSRDYTVVFNLDTVSGVEAGDVMLVTKDASGGTNPTYACGCYKITDVDTVNDRVTITSSHYKGAPSGAVTASVKIFKTVINCPFDSYLELSKGSTINIGDLALVGDVYGAGLFSGNNSTIKCLYPIGINGFGYCIRAGVGGIIEAPACGLSNFNGGAIYIHDGSLIYAPGIVINGANEHGVICYYQSKFIANSGLVSTGNKYHGVFCGYNSTCSVIDSACTGNNGYGWHALYGGGIRRTGTCIGGNNTSGDTYTSGSYAWIQT
jgi:hypothetical protein